MTVLRFLMRLIWLTYVIIIFKIDCVRLKKVFTADAVQGYYWRDLVGEVPEGAVPGGIDSNGNITYIGQTVHYSGGGSILTGAYIPNEKKMYYEYGSQQYTAVRRIKILCGQNLEVFYWIPVKYDEKVDRAPNMQFVLGGDDTNRDLAIGRLKFGDEVVVGKVLIIDKTLKEMYYHWKGSGVSTTVYEILFFDKSIQSTCSTKSKIVINFFKNFP